MDEGAPLKSLPLGGRWHGEAVTDEEAISPQSLPLGGKVPPKGADEGAMIERFFVGPDALIGPLDGSFRRGISPPAGRSGTGPYGKAGEIPRIS